MSKTDFRIGSSSQAGLWRWIEERTQIHLKRHKLKQPKPWTEDEIFLEYKFTNAFRQLDKGTVVLNDFLSKIPHSKHEWILFTIMWYRMFNRDSNAHYFMKTLGRPPQNMEELEAGLVAIRQSGDKVFTGAHMTTGVAFEDKIDTYLRACNELYAGIPSVLAACEENTLESAFKCLCTFYLVGGFVGYEMVCDLRFTPILEKATDTMRWANIGPGAARGLQRLGLASKGSMGLKDMRMLLNVAERHLHPAFFNGKLVSWPFELREIEHSLCEFDKYERVRQGQGRPRQRYNGRPD